MNELILSVVQKKMERIQRRLERLAKVYFGKDMRVMFISKEKLDTATCKESEVDNPCKP